MKTTLTLGFLKPSLQAPRQKSTCKNKLFSPVSAFLSLIFFFLFLFIFRKEIAPFFVPLYTSHPRRSERTQDGSGGVQWFDKADDYSIESQLSYAQRYKDESVPSIQCNSTFTCAVEFSFDNECKIPKKPPKCATLHAKSKAVNISRGLQCALSTLASTLTALCF